MADRLLPFWQNTVSNCTAQIVSQFEVRCRKKCRTIGECGRDSNRVRFRANIFANARKGIFAACADVHWTWKYSLVGSCKVIET